MHTIQNDPNYFYRTDSTGELMYYLVNQFKKIREVVKLHLPEATGVKFGKFEDLLDFVEYDSNAFPTTMVDIQELLANSEPNNNELIKYEVDEREQFTTGEIRKKLRFNEIRYDGKTLDEYLNDLIRSYNAVKDVIVTRNGETLIAKKVRKDFKDAYTTLYNYYKQYKDLKALMATKKDTLFKKKIKNVSFPNGKTKEELQTMLDDFINEVKSEFTSFTAIARNEDNLYATSNKRYIVRPLNELFTTIEHLKPLKLHYIDPLSPGEMKQFIEITDDNTYPTSNNTRESLIELLTEVHGDKGFTTLVDTLINDKYNDVVTELTPLIAYETELFTAKEALQNGEINSEAADFTGDLEKARNYDRDTDKQEVAKMIERMKFYITTLKGLIKIKDKPSYNTIADDIKDAAVTHLYTKKLKSFPLVVSNGLMVEPSEDESNNNYDTTMNTGTYDDLDDLRKAQYVYKHLQTVYVQKAALTPERVTELRTNYNSFLEALNTLRTETGKSTLNSVLTEVSEGLGGVN